MQPLKWLACPTSPSFARCLQKSAPTNTDTQNGQPSYEELKVGCQVKDTGNKWEMKTTWCVTVLQSSCYDTEVDWSVKQTETRYFYNSNTDIFKSDLMWSKLNAEKVKKVIAWLEEQCCLKNLKLKDMQDVLY